MSKQYTYDFRGRDGVASVSITEGLGGWSEVTAVVGGEMFAEKVQGWGNAMRKFLQCLDIQFANGGVLVNVDGRRYSRHELTATVRRTVADAVALGAHPIDVPAAAQSVRAKIVQPAERQAMIQFAMSVLWDWRATGRVNQRWSEMPSLDEALLSALVPA